MKKVFCLVAGSIFALNVFAQSAGDDMTTGSSSEMWKDKFCAKMINGKTVVMHNDKELTSDFTASSGVKIKTDGTVIKKDGSTLMLKEGECVNTQGNFEKKGLMKSDKSEKKEHGKELRKESGKNKSNY